MRIDRVDTWEAKIYVGQREGYDGPFITEQRVSDAIASYQRAAPESERGCVRITQTRYQFIDYVELGWEIGLLQYPRFPLDNVSRAKFAKNLAIHLLNELNQNRVGVVSGINTYLYSQDDAQESPKTPTVEVGFKVGDFVRIVDEPPEVGGDTPGWPAEMDATCGKIGKIHIVYKSGHYGVRFTNDDSWSYHPTWISKVTPPALTKDDFKVGDKVRVVSEKPSDADTGPGWVSDMNKLLGQNGLVSYSGEYIRVEFEGPHDAWSWKPNWLIKETASPSPISSLSLLKKMNEADQVVFDSLDLAGQKRLSFMNPKKYLSVIDNLIKETSNGM